MPPIDSTQVGHVARGERASDNQLVGVHRLLLATDLSSASERATDEAIRLAVEFSAELVVLSIIDPGRLRLRRTVPAASRPGASADRDQCPEAREPGSAGGRASDIPRLGGRAGRGDPRRVRRRERGRHRPRLARPRPSRPAGPRQHLHPRLRAGALSGPCRGGVKAGAAREHNADGLWSSSKHIEGVAMFARYRSPVSPLAIIAAAQQRRRSR